MYMPEKNHQEKHPSAYLLPQIELIYRPKRTHCPVASVQCPITPRL